MNIRDELNREMRAPEGGRTLGEAANRWVTYQMVGGVIGAVVALALFLFFLFYFFVPMWRSFP